MITTNWVANPFAWQVTRSITRMLLQTNWAGTPEQKLAVYLNQTKDSSDTWGNAGNPCYYDNGLKMAAIYLTTDEVLEGPYGSEILAEISVNGILTYKLWYKFVTEQIPRKP